MNSFDVVLNIMNHSFYITETPIKSEDPNLAMSKLLKIQFIVSNNLDYSKQHTDKYSSLEKERLFKILDNKSVEIRDEYKEKVSQLDQVQQQLYSIKDIEIIQKDIENYISPPEALPTLPRELVQHVTKYLDANGLARFAQINREAKANVEPQLLHLAQKYGYTGKDKNEASKYLNALFSSVKDLCQQGLLHHDKNISLNAEQILESLTSEQIYNLLNQKKIHTPSFEVLQKALLVILERPIHVKYNQLYNLLSRDERDEIEQQLN